MILIVDYGMGNLGSLLNMFRKLGIPAEASADPERVTEAKKLLLPGVGAFDAGREHLASRGLDNALSRQVIEKGIPILGICLGMQLFTKRSEEGGLPGLGWLDAETVRFRAAPGLKVPHMGWKGIAPAREHPLLTGLISSRFYFVHSYRVSCRSDRYILATADHGGLFPAVIASGNIMGTQFHPEKSHKFGMRLLRNFAEMEIPA